jgi:hypothetical protein
MISTKSRLAIASVGLVAVLFCTLTAAFHTREQLKPAMMEPRGSSPKKCANCSSKTRRCW